MAATITKKGAVISITGIDADVPFSSISVGGGTGALDIQSITFVAGSGQDVLVIREETVAGPSVFREKVAAAGLSSTVYFSGIDVRPCIKFSDCTLTAGHEVIIRLN